MRKRHSHSQFCTHLHLSHLSSSSLSMDAFFVIATPIPEETEQVPANYDTGSGSGGATSSCTIA